MSAPSLSPCNTWGSALWIPIASPACSQIQTGVPVFQNPPTGSKSGPILGCAGYL